MALTYRIVRAEADSDFGKIRQLYYETWQSAYRDLMPASYLQQLTPATWRPERRWQNMLLAMTADGEVVGVCTFGPARHANYEGWGRTVFAICSPELSSSWHWSAINNPGPPSLKGGLSTELSTCSGK
ncbi:acetyltransferase [Lactiplantibacillus plantarum]|uniref:hypothetical protein n=1 Tax=Lactiplantibacillus plantarum TaxID=1590 RepID=UPI003852694D|nr:acetyltransferase [Lactiplantibacillus plantarum]